MKKVYIPDLIALDKVVLELKVLEKLASREESQLLTYLKATGYKVGLLLNFGSHPISSHGIPKPLTRNR